MKVLYNNINLAFYDKEIMMELLEQDVTVIYRSPDPKGVFVYSPAITVLKNGT